MQNRINQAINETQRMLDKQLSYSFDLQKPVAIKFYRDHLAFLKGETTARAVVEGDWDRMNCEA